MLGQTDRQRNAVVRSGGGRGEELIGLIDDDEEEPSVTAMG